MKKLIRNTLFTLSMVSLSLLLAACSSASFCGSRTGNSSQLIMEYSIFNTTDSQFLELENGDIIDAGVVSDSGKLSVTIRKEEEEPVYEGENIPTSTFQIEIKEDGFYKISATGEKAEGSLSFVKREKQNTGEIGISSMAESYYAGQASRAFTMLHKSIFKKLLTNGWLEDIGRAESAEWNYDTFTEYAVLEDSTMMDSGSEQLYCCTFTADHDRFGYMVISYDGDSLSKIRTVETSYLYDLRSDIDRLKKELHNTEIDLSTATALRVQSVGKDKHTSEEGIYIADGKGIEYFYCFDKPEQ